MKKLGCLIIFALIGYVAYITNPTEQEHIDNAYEVMAENGVKDFGVNGDYLNVGKKILGKNNMDKLMNKFIERKNYYLFSLTELDLNDDKQIIAVGLFGKLWSIDSAQEIEESIKKKVKDIMPD